MKNLLLRFMGLFLMAIALVGILICCTGIFGIWKFKSGAETESIEILDLVSETLDSASQGINNTQTVLDAADVSMTSLDASLAVIDVTMTNSTHFFETTYTLTSDTLPNTIRSTQKAIQAAAQSAKIVDDTLSIVAAIPLIGSGYKPDIPLNEALQEISVSLEPLPGTIEGIKDDVEQIKDNMLEIQAHLEDAKGQTERIKTSLAQAKDVLDKLNDLIRRLKPRISTLRQQVTRGFNIIVWGLTVFLVWFALAQMGLIIQGLQLILAERFRKDSVREDRSDR